MAERTETLPNEGERRRLVRLAYRLLGSVEEAEDVVQDAQVKLLGSEVAPPRDAGAYLFRTVTNLAIDRLRHLAVQRRAYTGPWLPEPLPTEPAETDLARADDLSVGFLVLLERLSASERAVFVLREGFDLSFDETAGILGIRADAARQRYRRARRKLEGARRAPAPDQVQRKLLDRLVEAVIAGDTNRVAALLTEDAVLLADGGGRVSGAVRPVEDPRRIAQVLVHIAARENAADFDLEFQTLNGAPALIVYQRVGEDRRSTFGSIQIEAEEGRIARIYVMRNPEKLSRL